jgi:hypothetical protein
MNRWTMHSNERTSLTSTEQSIRNRIAQEWRIRCPKGHAHLVDKDGPSVYCKTCNEGYRYDDLVDARQDSEVFRVTPPEDYDA